MNLEGQGLPTLRRNGLSSAALVCPRKVPPQVRLVYPPAVSALRFSVLANDVLRLVGPGIDCGTSAADSLLGWLSPRLFCGSVAALGEL